MKATKCSKHDWKDYTIAEFWDGMGCNEAFETERPVHRTSTWTMLREKYESVVGLERSSISPLSSKSGFKVPFEVRQVPGKGRGLFLSRRVQEGDVLWEPKQTAVFRNGPSYQHFLSLTFLDLGCDVIQFSYVEKDANADAIGGKLILSVDLDDGALANQGEVLGEDLANIDSKGDNYIALRNISASEEILCMYNDFAVPHGWVDFGLL